MRLSYTLALGLLPFTLAAPVAHESYAAPVITTLQLLSGELGLLIRDVKGFNGSPQTFSVLTQQAAGALSTLQRSFTDVMAGPAFGPLSSTTILPATTKLDAQIHDLANELEMRKPQIDALGPEAVAQVAQLLEREYVGTSQLVSAFSMKIPGAYWTIARRAIEEMPRRIGRTMNIYKGLAPTTPLPAVSLGAPTQIGH